MTPVYLLLCFTIASVYGRVAVTDVLSEADLNKIHDESKIDLISIEDDIDAVVSKLGYAVDDNNIGIDVKPCVDTKKPKKIDNGTALILTPLIEQGRVEEARNACRVDRSLFLGIDSYSGFLTVNSTYKSHLYFWYFPSFTKPVNETPWIIWLQGGPGVSSLAGLFEEIGPFSANDGLKFNPHTWLMNHSLVFIDNPVGTGYSFTEHEDGYARDMATYGKHLHIALKQLVQIFPELRVAPLYVAGESYAGKYVPALGMQIHKHKNTPGTDINFKGLIVGNGFVEPEMITQLTRTYYKFGMLDLEQLEAIQPLVDVFLADVAANRSIEARQKYYQLLGLVQNISHQTRPYNFLVNYNTSWQFVSFLSKPEIKRALHVGDIKFSFANGTVSSLLGMDFLSSSKSLFEELLNTYRVLVYCGHLDQMVPCTATSERLRLWKWSESSEFIESWRYPFFIDEKLAGYYKTGGNLTWAVVVGAGHIVPRDQPVSSQRLISNWTHSLPLISQTSFKLEDMNISPMQKLRMIVKKIITTTNQTSNITSDAKNQTGNSTSDAMNQTGNNTSVEKNQTSNNTSDEKNQTDNITSDTNNNQTSNSTSDEKNQTDNITSDTNNNQTSNSTSDEKNQTDNITSDTNNQTNNSTSSSNQTGNNTSDENNQTSNGATDDVNSQTSEESIVFQMNLNNIIVKSYQTSARSIIVNVNMTQTSEKSVIHNINVLN